MDSDLDANIPTAIAERIPHRPPMLLIDEIVEEDEKTIHCRRRIRSDEFFVQGHYPDNPIVPGVILCEIGAQAGALLLATKVSGEGVPVLTRLGDARFKQIVRPSDVIDVNVSIDEQLANAFYLTARLTVEGKLAVRFSFACTLASPPNP